MYVTFQSVLDILFPPSADLLLVRKAPPDEVFDCMFIHTIDGVVTLTDFRRDLVRALIHEAKFHYNRKALRILGDVLQRYFSEYPLPHNTVLIPMPLSKSRQRKRGYNQVTEILKCAGYRANENVLSRIKNTKPQTELGREARKENVADAFGVRDPSGVTGKHILIIDDVLTTGATMRAAKAELLRHKPASVTCIALAH